jgi:hypothetical protein
LAHHVANQPLRSVEKRPGALKNGLIVGGKSKDGGWLANSNPAKRAGPALGLAKVYKKWGRRSVTVGRLGHKGVTAAVPGADGR